MMEAILSSETSVVISATRRNITEDVIFHLWENADSSVSIGRAGVWTAVLGFLSETRGVSLPQILLSSLRPQRRLLLIDKEVTAGTDHPPRAKIRNYGSIAHSEEWCPLGCYDV
jgi:hypothetical protein